MRTMFIHALDTHSKQTFGILWLGCLTNPFLWPTTILWMSKRSKVKKDTYLVLKEKSNSKVSITDCISAWKWKWIVMANQSESMGLKFLRIDTTREFLLALDDLEIKIGLTKVIARARLGSWPFSLQFEIENRPKTSQNSILSLKTIFD